MLRLNLILLIPVPGSFDSLSSLFWMGDAILFLLLSLLPALIFRVTRLALSPVHLPGGLAQLPLIPPPRTAI